MENQTYQESVNWLFSKFPSYQKIGGPAYKPGLSNVLKLCEVFGNPQNKLKFVHVAGSNGKGSTCSILASFLTENKVKTGLFTSPHLVDFRERIRVNGEMISEVDVILFCKKVVSFELDFEPSFFEISFVMALDYFVNSKLDICIIETGLGGRLDATNIIVPLLSIITTISLEHTNFLGNSLEEIAIEKAGIIKAKTPIIISRRNSYSEKIFTEKSQKVNAPLLFTEDFNFPMPRSFPLLGEYQNQNFQTVCLAIELLKDHVLLSLNKMEVALKNLTKNSGFQGRLQIVEENPRVIFDVSHNPEGLKATVDFLKKEYGKLTIVYGSSSDKNFEDIFLLFPKDDSYFFTEFSNERSASIAELKIHSRNAGLNAHFFTNPIIALNQAKSLCHSEDTIVVLGSFFLLHDFLK